jgi:hypothetical protein
MLGWLKKASGNAQRKNVSRTLSLLITAAAAADRRIAERGSSNQQDVAHITSLQRSLLGDLIGPIPLADLRNEFLDPLLHDGTVSEGVKTAVKHVFDTAAQQAR